MQILIWVGCFLGITIINLIIGEAFGFRAGYLVLYLVVAFVAKKLCALYERHLYRKAHPEREKSRFTECPKCKYLAVFDKKCPKCGYVLPSSIPVPQTAANSFCTKCGAQLLENAEFCNHCGAKK